MTDIKLFKISSGVSELAAKSVALERDLQSLIEQNMLCFFGVTFLKSEYVIANGRIDSLGLDENSCPVIFEYKRSINENVINQGLFYLDWLLDHKADFKLLVMDKLGKDKADLIDWSIPCVICIASDFTKFDEHAVNLMQRNIKLVKYKKFGEDLIIFEYLNAPSVKPLPDGHAVTKILKGSTDKTFREQYTESPVELQNIYESIKDYILSLGDDITENELKLYIAFKKVKNVICAEIYKSKILLHLRIDPNSVELKKDFVVDVSKIGHFGTGDLRIIIKDYSDFDNSKSFIERAYNEN